MAVSKDNIFDSHMLEIVFSIIVIVLSIISTKYGISEETAWVVGICTTLVSISIVIIKKHITDVASELLTGFERRIAKDNDMIYHISSLDGVAFKYAKEILGDAGTKIKEIKDGKVFLNQETYYDHINQCMRDAKSGSTILALNCIDSLRWSKDARQVNYLIENIEAAKRGAKIHRIFLIDNLNTINEGSQERIDNIKKHLDCENIATDIVLTEDLAGFDSEIEDMVIFSCKEKRLYVDYPDNAKKTNISHAYLFLCEKDIAERCQIFKKLLNYKISDDEKIKFISGDA